MKSNREKVASEVFEIEAEAIKSLNSVLNENFDKAIDLLLNTKGKVVVTGMGKSGLIGRKFASTLSSTGTPSFFLHPAESSHGDLGVITEEDIVVAISYGGKSSEMAALLGFTSRKGIPLIAMTANSESDLAKAGSVVLSIAVKKEACPINLAPTASSTATLALCDAIAMVLLEEKGFKEEDFAEFHPGGALGKKLLTKVEDVMHTAQSLPLVKRETSFKEVLDIMTTRDVRGVCGVVDESDELIGIITDGDVRRWIGRVFDQEKTRDQIKASDLMSLNPKRIDQDELAQKALYLMEQFSIQCLFVVDSQSSNANKPVGLVHLQDLLDAKIA